MNPKRLPALMALLVEMMVPTSAQQFVLPAFSGADGPAKYASGGRGGVVYHVTKLNSALDDPERMTPGTLWYGLSSAVPSPKTIVFDVAGVFHLGKMDTTNWSSEGNAWDATSRISLSADNVTIAGETAPGPVIIMGGTLKPAGSNMIIRNITIAAGYGMKAFWEPGQSQPAPGTLPTSYTMDAMDISGKMIMIDHLDAIFCTDETISCNENAENFTVQYALCALAQNYNQHSYAHAFGAGTAKKLALLHTLDAHIRGRVPRVGAEVGTGGLYDFRNNVFYNWMGTAGYSGAAQWSFVNFINNFYLAGPGGDTDWDSTGAGGTGIFSGSSGYTFGFISGNLKDINKDSDPFDTASADSDFSSVTTQSTAFDIDIGVTLPAARAFTNVLRHAGSRWWERDLDRITGPTNAVNAIAARVVRNVLTGTGRIQAWADDPYNLSGTYQADPANEGAEWRALWALRPINGVPPFSRPSNWDSDQDGIPNFWETTLGLNPNAANNNADFDSDGYTDLEEYLHDVAAWPAPGPIVFTGEENARYARIFNWRVYGVQLPITNKGVVTTFSYWQPSRYDTVLISNRTAVVDAPGQHAGILILTNAATLNITNGWLHVSGALQVGTNCVLRVLGPASLRITNWIVNPAAFTNRWLVNNGTMILSGNAGLIVDGWFTNNGTLDISGWSNSLPPNFVNNGVLITNAGGAPPPAPTGLSATAGNAQVLLTWNAASGATAYVVKRSTTSGSGYTRIATNATTSYLDTAVTNGVTYYYVVAALNAAGEGPNSAEVSATPTQPPPQPPTGLTATGGYAQVVLNWNASAGATAYVIKRSTTPGGGYVPIATNSATSYTDLAVTNGVTYYYVVSALNAAGESANSAEASATPRVQPPTGLTAAAGNGTVTLSWNPSTGAVAYIIKRSTTSGGPYTPVATNTAISYVDTGLINGVTYYYVVSALGDGGESLNSAQVSATPASPAGALIAYEGFNYSADTSIGGLDGGFGWGAAWATGGAASMATNLPVSLSYGTAGLRLATSGGCLLVGSSNGITPANTTVQIQRQLPNTLANLAGGQGTIWISFLYQNLQADQAGFIGFRETGIRLMAGATTNTTGVSNRDGVDKLDAGSPNTYPAGAGFDELALFIAPTYIRSGIPTPRGTDPSNVVLVLMRIDVDNTTANDTARAWFFLNGAGLNGEPNPESALVFTNTDLSGVNALRFQSGNANSYATNAFWLLDEIRVGRSYADVVPTLAATNSPPVLAPIADRTINVGVNLIITNAATDPDVPPQSLTFCLLTAVTNATIDPATGIFQWRPLVWQAGTTNLFTVIVADNGSPSLTATQSFVVLVNRLEPPVLAAPSLENGQLALTVHGQVGPDYAIQVSTNLRDWDTIMVTNPSGLPFTWSMNIGVRPAEFYRVRLGPPLP